jgi:hypothetical protein
LRAITDIERLETLVWDVIADLSHRGEATVNPHSAECAELRKAAYVAAGVKGDDPLIPAGKTLAHSVLGWLQGVTSFDAVQAASRKYEGNRIKT